MSEQKNTNNTSQIRNFQDSASGLFSANKNANVKTTKPTTNSNSEQNKKKSK